MEIFPALISRLRNKGTCIHIGLKLPGSVVKPRPLKSQQEIPGNKALATRQQKCPLSRSEGDRLLPGVYMYVPVKVFFFI